MYQMFVVMLGLALLFSAGYYIKHTDREGVIIQSAPMEAVTGTSTQSLSLDDLPGTYSCDTNSRCLSPRILTITRYGDVTMSTSRAESVEVLDEVGTWKAGPGNSFIITFTGTPSSSYPESLTATMQQVSSSSLMGLEKGTTYKDWKYVVFTKKAEE